MLQLVEAKSREVVVHLTPGEPTTRIVIASSVLPFLELLLLTLLQHEFDLKKKHSKMQSEADDEDMGSVPMLCPTLTPDSDAATGAVMCCRLGVW